MDTYAIVASVLLQVITGCLGVAWAGLIFLGDFIYYKYYIYIYMIYYYKYYVYLHIYIHDIRGPSFIEA